MRELLQWLAEGNEHPLIQSSVFHYEFEFIHPFADGNGRMGRLWQTLILSQWNPIFSQYPCRKLDLSKPKSLLRCIASEHRMAQILHLLLSLFCR